MFKKKTLIVIDMQYDFIYGPLGTDEAIAIVPKVKQKIEEYRERGDEIIFTKDTHYNDYFKTHEGKRLPVKHCMINSYGWEIIPELKPSKDIDIVVHKHTFGSNWWYEYLLRRSLARVDEIELIGVCTDICVVSNALILRSLLTYTDIIVDASCCAGTTPEKHKAALEVMKSCHIDIINE